MWYNVQMNHLHTERIKYITAVVLYGTVGMCLRFSGMPGELVAMCRGVLGTVFILLYMRVRRMPFRWDGVRRDAGLLVLSGVLLGLNWVFLFAAYLITTVAIASLCNYMAPLFVVLAAPFVLREKLNGKKLFCVFLAFAGILLVSGVAEGEGGNLPGVLTGLLAALCFTCIVLCNRKMKAVGVYERVVVQLGVSALTVLPYVIYKNAGTALLLGPRSILIVLMLGIVHTGFAYCLYFSGMATLPVQTVAVLGYLEPVVSVLCSAIFLREAMTPLGVAGAALIIAAAVISERTQDAAAE